MVARTQLAEQGLQAQDVATRLKAVRELKNQIIGNKFKKLQHLHLVPLLLELVSSNSSSNAELQIQAISTLGSLAYGVEDGVRAIVAANGIQAIVSALESGDQRVVVAAARSLKLLYQASARRHTRCCSMHLSSHHCSPMLEVMSTCATGTAGVFNTSDALQACAASPLCKLSTGQQSLQGPSL
jgi:regulator of extracellular matrix RemA (YlzA/DUF370 family)